MLTDLGIQGQEYGATSKDSSPALRWSTGSRVWLLPRVGQVPQPCARGYLPSSHLMGNGATSHAQLCPHCFDLSTSSSSFSTTTSPAPQPCESGEELVHYRPATVSGWLTHWELDRLSPVLASFGFQAPAQVRLLTAEHHRRVSEVLPNKLHPSWNRAARSC